MLRHIVVGVLGALFTFTVLGAVEPLRETQHEADVDLGYMVVAALAGGVLLAVLDA